MAERVLYRCTDFTSTRVEIILVKNKDVDDAVSKIIRAKAISDEHLESLDSSGKQRVLMRIASFCQSGVDSDLVLEAIQLLGYREDEVLVFAAAAKGAGKYDTSLEIVKRFCKRTKIARGVLHSIALKTILQLAKRRDEQYIQNHVCFYLNRVIECIRLCGEKMGHRTSGIHDSICTNRAVEMLTLCNWLESRYPDILEDLDGVRSSLREHVQTEEAWMYIEERVKFRSEH